MKKLAVLIPAYNEVDNISRVFFEIPKKIDGIDEIVVIIVDDGSTDGTFNIIKDLPAVVVRHPDNLGLGAAFKSGVKKSLELNADYMVNLDADGQFNPDDIEKLISPLQKNSADFVTASRFVDKNLLPQSMPKVKIWGNRLMSMMVGIILKKKFSDVSCGFRAYNKEALQHLNLFGDFTYTQETFLDLGAKGLKIAEVPARVKYFQNRTSAISGNLWRYGWRTFKIIFRAARDYKPLKTFGAIGFIFFIFGLALDAALLIYYFYVGSLSPYKIIGFGGAFFNILGIIIFFLGLLGDMLYRIRINQEEILYQLKKKQ